MILVDTSVWIDFFNNNNNEKVQFGFTVTPERIDNKDVFAICGYNVVYETRLKDAINKGWLVPFR